MVIHSRTMVSKKAWHQPGRWEAGTRRTSAASVWAVSSCTSGLSLIHMQKKSAFQIRSVETSSRRSALRDSHRRSALTA